MSSDSTDGQSDTGALRERDALRRLGALRRLWTLADRLRGRRRREAVARRRRAFDLGDVSYAWRVARLPSNSPRCHGRGRLEETPAPGRGSAPPSGREPPQGALIASGGPAARRRDLLSFLREDPLVPRLRWGSSSTAVFSQVEPVLVAEDPSSQAAVCICAQAPRTPRDLLAKIPELLEAEMPPDASASTYNAIFALFFGRRSHYPGLTVVASM